MGSVTTFTPGRVRAAFAVAILADAVELGLFPVFAEGVLSPVNDVLDLAVAAALVLLLGWHWAFVPSLVAEAVPGLTLFPTWTAAVLFVTRGGTAKRGPAEGGEPSGPERRIEPPATDR
jgi:hypothetical protein